MEYIRMIFERGGELTIGLNSDQAPQTVASILNSLPFESRLTHTRWCGREVYFDFYTKKLGSKLFPPGKGRRKPYPSIMGRNICPFTEDGLQSIESGGSCGSRRKCLTKSGRESGKRERKKYGLKNCDWKKKGVLHEKNGKKMVGAVLDVHSCTFFLRREWGR